MKTLSSLLLILFFTGTCLAQGVFSNQTSYTIEKVLQEYPGQFKNIRGALITAGPGLAEYKSTLTMPGAVSSTITLFASSHKQNVSWQTVLYAGNEFNTAKKHFEILFSQIKNTIIRPTGERPVIVNGQYKNPLEENSSDTIIPFDLLPASGALQKINIDLVMKNAGGQWQIVLSVYDHERKELPSLSAN
jgi:hypothetical protein